MAWFFVLFIHMDWFDAFDEVFASVERYVAENGKAPAELLVSPTLYNWLAELQRESDFLEGIATTDPVVLETSYGHIPLVIDEKLDPYEIIAA